ncbi:uncharacterized protein F54H12.2, partial [Trichonephila clavipes]
MSHIMKVPYVCCTKKFEDYYTNHIGSGVPYYEGVSFQKDYGLGGIFRVKGRKEALRTGTRVVSDVLSGEDFKIAARKRSEEAGRVDFKIKLIRSKPEFCLHGKKGYKVTLEKITLLERKVLVSPGVVLGHKKALEKETAKYPINRVQCKVYSIPQGSMSFVQDNIFIGQMPKRIVVGCVDNDSFHSTFEKSPFDFKHYINFIGVYVDGQPTPHNPLDLNLAQNNYIKGYHSLFSGTEKLGQDQSLFISREEYISGNTLVAFNLSPDLCTGDHLNLIKHRIGRLRVSEKIPTKQSVAELTLLIEEKLESKTPCNNALNPLEQVLVALRFYAVACMQLAIADLFDVSQPTVCRVVHRVSEAIASLLPDFIHLPVNREECKT